MMENYTIEEAGEYFARSLNKEVWQLLQKTERTSAENERMIHCAHASCYHWLNAGTPLHQQRAEWLIAHVYAKLGIPDSAMRHANCTLQLTQAHADVMQDFDLAYAYEAVARANALAGNWTEALANFQTAKKYGEAIKDDEDRKIFFGDFYDGDWFGIDR